MRIGGGGNCQQHQAAPSASTSVPSSSTAAPNGLAASGATNAEAAQIQRLLAQHSQDGVQEAEALVSSSTLTDKEKQDLLGDLQEKGTTMNAQDIADFVKEFQEYQAEGDQSSY
jgi:hypothetical protein